MFCPWARLVLALSCVACWLAGVSTASPLPTRPRPPSLLACDTPDCPRSWQSPELAAEQGAEMFVARLMAARFYPEQHLFRRTGRRAECRTLERPEQLECRVEVILNTFEAGTGTPLAVLPNDYVVRLHLRCPQPGQMPHGAWPATTCAPPPREQASGAVAARAHARRARLAASSPSPATAQAR